MRKNRGVFFILNFVLIILVFIGLNTLLTKVDSYVIRKGYVENVNGKIVKIIDTTGTAWEWEEEKERFNKWDNVKMIMDNNNTTTTEKDDIILRIKLDK